MWRVTVSVWGFQERLRAEREEEHGLEAEKPPSGADVGQKLPEAQGGRGGHRREAAGAAGDRRGRGVCGTENVRRMTRRPTAPFDGLPSGRGRPPRRTGRRRPEQDSDVIRFAFPRSPSWLPGEENS